MELEFLGGCKTVGGSAVLLSTRNTNFLLDFGIYMQNEPRIPLGVRPSRLYGVIITHAHLDHSGATPVLYTSATPHLFTTPLTLTLMRLLLRDMINLSGYYLPYEEQEINQMAENLHPVFFGTVIPVKPSVKLEFIDSGHIPGGIAPIIYSGRKKVLYTGDFNTIDTRLIRGARFNSPDYDVVITESTYALSDHPERVENEEKFVRFVQEVVDQGGVVLVPAFAVARSQEILCVLTKHNFEGPITLDGLSKEVTRIYTKHSPYLRSTKLLKKAIKRTYFAKSNRDRKHAVSKPGVIVSTAGMLKGGPATFYLSKLQDNPRNAIVLVSYQLPQSPGRQLLDDGKITINGHQSKVSAKIQFFDFSSHSGSKEIMRFLKRCAASHKNPGDLQVYCIHGEADACEGLAKKLSDEIGCRAIAPETGDKFQIE